MLRNTYINWGIASRTFHWLLAAMILGMIAFGWWMNHFPARPDRFFYRSIHADIGYLVLLLMALRLIWRLLNPVPVQPLDEPGWMKIAAKVSHFALYAMVFVVTLLGWAHSGAHKPDYANWFGLFRVPQFTSENRADAQFYEDWHIYAAYALLALAVIHLAAALFHHFGRRDNVLSRMLAGTPES